MTLDLYNWKGMRNSLTKYLNIVAITYDNFVFKDRVGDIDLEVTVTYSDELRDATYAIISEDSLGTDYSYFIDNFEHLTNGMAVLHLHMDVLRQYRSSILNMIQNGDMICIRSGSLNVAEGQPLEDDTVSIGARTADDQNVTRFGSVLTWDNPYYILIVAGSYGVFHSTSPATLSEGDGNNENIETVS